MLRLRATQVVEYDANPADYDGCEGDPVKMAAYDQQSLDEGDIANVSEMGTTVSIVVEPC
jgi:hypothetical protein